MPYSRGELARPHHRRYNNRMFDMTVTTRLTSICLLLLTINAHAETLSLDLHESVSTLDVTVKDFYGTEQTGKVAITQFLPDGDGPFPILILNHGRSPTDRSTPLRFRFTRQVAYFVKRGFAVIEPTRIGYGQFGTQFDPEYSGKCRQKDYAPMIEAARTEERAVLDYARRQPRVDPRRIVIVGQSVGGFITTAMVAENPDGVVAAINFAGGSGGDPVEHPGVPCQGERLEALYSRFGKTARVPMLWIYTENDQYFAPTYSRAWHDAFVRAGGNADYRLLPPFEKNGHMLFAHGIDVWQPVVSEFLERQGFPPRAQP
ncbi:alpha/beta hydrolase family protein [Burkholderia territorii]|uniref:alpha/beta hydrolase family protein n=1 Tax=Burkholderia territorii TaxID=1503055 RepID=UPI001E302907|nr:alpha/beta fold hydrolase [Burkholderia territorii]